MTEYNTIYEMCQAYADWCNDNDKLHARTQNDDYSLYFVSGRVSGRETTDTVTFCFTGAKNQFDKYPSYLIQTS